MPELARARNSVIGLLLVAVVAGVAWSGFASPALLTVRSGGQVVLTEEHAGAQFSVVMLFIGIGAAVSITWGVYCALRFSSWGPWILALAVLGSAAAAVVCWLIGSQLGPNDPTTLAHLSGGETLRDKLRIDSVAPFLMWPWCAAVAAGLTIVFSSSGSPGSEPSQLPEPSERSQGTTAPPAT